MVLSEKISDPGSKIFANTAEIMKLRLCKTINKKKTGSLEALSEFSIRKAAAVILDAKVMAAASHGAKVCC